MDEFLQHPYDHLHVSGYLLLDRPPGAWPNARFERPNEFGSSTSIDVCSVAPLRAMTPEVFLQAASHASKIFANEEEAPGAHEHRARSRGAGESVGDLP